MECFLSFELDTAALYLRDAEWLMGPEMEWSESSSVH